jgi:small subunit ribosomal protein S21e
MQNEKGEVVDIYIPRKCSWTNRILVSKDHGSVQINVANVDPETGLATGEFTPFAFSGKLRFNANSDMALKELVVRNDAALQAQE